MVPDEVGTPNSIPKMNLDGIRHGDSGSFATETELGSVTGTGLAAGKSPTNYQTSVVVPETIEEHDDDAEQPRDEVGQASAGEGEKRTAAKRKSAAHLKKSLEEAPSKEAKKRVDAVKEDYNVAKAASKPQ